jgi:ankyrin repeat protein
MAKVLLAIKGVYINNVDEKGWSPLFWAAEKCDLETVKLLVEANADLNLRSFNSRQWTALDRAVAFRN